MTLCFVHEALASYAGAMKHNIIQHNSNQVGVLHSPCCCEYSELRHVVPCSPCKHGGEPKPLDLGPPGPTQAEHQEAGVVQP